jgi:hypothetical protein
MSRKVIKLSKPNIYELGTTVNFVLSATDIDGNPITPTEARISIEYGDTITTVSGVAMTPDGNDLTYAYIPSGKGWNIYEAWVKDNVGRESAASKGFYVVDTVVE